MRDDAGMNGPLLDLARGGDQEAFRRLTDPHLRELQVHIYRMVGSVHDAEDLLQDTLLAAWRGLGGFAGQASLRTWLYRIATNRTLDALRAQTRRGAHRYEPYPDDLLGGLPDTAPGPDVRYEQKEALALVFVAGLMRLSPLQRGVLVLRDVLGYSAAETAAMLGTSGDAVNSLLRRARAAFATRPPSLARAALPDARAERDTLDHLARAFESGDIDAVVALLADDAWLTMPPHALELEGRSAIGAFLHERQEERGVPLQLAETRANARPAFLCSWPGPNGIVPIGLLTVHLEGHAIASMTWFSDSEVLSRFGSAPPDRRAEVRDNP